MTTVIFSHGQESGPWGTKIRAMSAVVKALGCEVQSIDYQGIKDPTERVDKLLAEASNINDQLILIGSSMGGHVATAAAARLGASGLFLLAPAYYMVGFEALTPAAPEIPICIIHGWNDDIVPVDNSIRFARSSKATLLIVDGDHRLTSNISDINKALEDFVRKVSGEICNREGK